MSRLLLYFCSVGSGAQRWEIVQFHSTLAHSPSAVVSLLVGLVSSLSPLVCFILPVILHFRPRAPLFCHRLNRGITSSPHHRYIISLRPSSSRFLVCRCLADLTRHLFTLLTPFLCFAYLLVVPRIP